MAQVARTGTIGNIGHYTDDIPYNNVRINSGMLVIRGGDNYNNRFLYCFLRSKLFISQVENLMSGSVQDQLPIWVINFIKLPKLDVPSQVKISSIISTLDSKIELNNRIKAELEVMAKTLYDYWFVQFDFPDLEGKPYKTNGNKMVWNDTLRQEIPEGWEVKQLSKVLRTSLGGTPSTKNKEYWKNANIPWLNSGEIATFPVISSNGFITQSGVDHSAATILPKGSVLISIVRYIRPSILAIDACTNQSVVGIYESKEIKNTYIYPYLLNEVPRLMVTRTGAQQPHINKASIDCGFR